MTELGARAELLGKRVRVKLDENVVQEGTLLGFGEGGDIEIEGDDGLVWSGWPALEVAPAVVVAAVVLIAFLKGFKFTQLLYVLMWLHAIVLIVGGKYSYALNPGFEWLKQTFDLERNYYDRLGHFMQGFVPAMIAREVLLRLQVVTRRAPTDAEMRDLLFSWRVAKFVKSNAIVYGRDGMTIGVGAGQMSRVNSARIAGIKAEHAGLQVEGAVMASDAFFPFRDGLDNAAEAGISAVIQPGGSMRDEEVIAAADEHGIAMVFTGRRTFRH